MKNLKFIYQLALITLAITFGLSAYHVEMSPYTTAITKIICVIISSLLLIIPAGIGYWTMIDNLKKD